MTPTTRTLPSGVRISFGASQQPALTALPAAASAATGKPNKNNPAPEAQAGVKSTHEKPSKQESIAKDAHLLTAIKSAGKNQSKQEQELIGSKYTKQNTSKQAINPRRQLIAKDTNLRTSLSQQLEAEVYECMVCFDAIKSRNPIWSCSTCFAVFHFKVSLT